MYSIEISGVRVKILTTLTLTPESRQNFYYEKYDWGGIMRCLESQRQMALQS